MFVKSEVLFCSLGGNKGCSIVVWSQEYSFILLDGNALFLGFLALPLTLCPMNLEKYPTSWKIYSKENFGPKTFIFYFLFQDGFKDFKELLPDKTCLQLIGNGHDKLNRSGPTS